MSDCCNDNIVCPKEPQPMPMIVEIDQWKPTTPTSASYHPRFVKQLRTVYIHEHAYSLVSRYGIFSIEDFASFVRHFKHVVADDLKWKASDVSKANRELFDLMFRISEVDWYSSRSYHKHAGILTRVPLRTEKMRENEAIFQLRDGTGIPKIF